MWVKCLSIAGFDPSGGAGIQACLKTFSALGCYGMTVLTALPVQNTQGVRRCYDLPLSAVQEQLEAIFEDVVPNSIQIGMLFQSKIVECVANFLKVHAFGIPIVLDPVMVAKSGDPLLMPDAIHALKQDLLPLASLITPNLAEAEALVGHPQDMVAQAHSILELGAKVVLLKGGHSQEKNAKDLFMDQSGHPLWLSSPRIESKNTHGTGCTLSAAIAAYLALGHSLLESCRLAKDYLFGALSAAQHHSVGKGHGPVHHFYRTWPSHDIA